MKVRRKMHFRTGLVNGMQDHERIFALNCMKQVKTSNLDEKQRRMFRRLLARFMGENLQRYPLHVDEQCPVCERTINGKAIQRHVLICKAREKERRVMKVDPSIYEMIEAGL